MTSIYQIEFEDIKEFLKQNNKKIFKNKNDAYNMALKLLKSSNIINHSVKIDEWMIARNLLINKINIPRYNICELDFATKDEIDELSKSLTMKGNDINSTKNILRYLGKLEERITFLPEINNIIIDKYSKLLEIDILSSNLCNIINIFKHNRFLRKFIYDNIRYIISKDRILIINGCYASYYVPDFIFELAELKEIFLAKKVLEMCNILAPTSGAILSCSRDYIRNYVKSQGSLPK